MTNRYWLLTYGPCPGTSLDCEHPCHSTLEQVILLDTKCNFFLSECLNSIASSTYSVASFSHHTSGCRWIILLSTSSWWNLCLIGMWMPDSSNEHLCSSQLQIKAVSAVTSHSIVLYLVLLPHEDVAGLVSEENVRFMQWTILTGSDNLKSHNGYRLVLQGYKTGTMTSRTQMRYAFRHPRDVEIEILIRHFAHMRRRIREIL
jgi:hypothetical protein